MSLSGLALDGPVDLASLLRTGFEEHPGRVAAASAGGEWTWAELHERSRALAVNLLGLGLEPGDRVASLMPNRIALMCHYLACFQVGLVAVPLNYRYTAREIDYALDLSGAAALLGHTERAPDLAASRTVPRLPRGVISYSDAVGEGDWEELSRTRSGPAELPSVAADDPALLFFTSGSTGKPKGVTHSLETMGWIVASVATVFGMRPADVVLPASSMSHMLALNLAFGALSRQATVVVAKELDAGPTIALLREHRPTVLALLSVALDHLVHDHGATGDDFASLRACHAGGDKIPPRCIGTSPSYRG